MRQFLGVAIFLLAAVPALICQADSKPSDSKPTVSNEPLSEERVKIYAAFLRSYMNTEERSTLNLARNTEPLELRETDLDGCAAGIDEASRKEAAAVLHTFREAGKPLENTTLVDAQHQAEIIRGNDPEHAIQDGKSVDDAVERAFSTGLFTFSEIAFDADHKLAVFAYSFYCGALCGHGGTVVMQRIGNEWRPSKRLCSRWIS